MKKSNNLILNFLLALVLGLLFACGNETSESKKKNVDIPLKPEKPAFKEQVALDKMVDKIEQNGDLLTAKSLIYTANNGDQQHVSALLDGEMKMQSLTIEKNLKDGKSIKTTFYFYKESLIVSKRLMKTFGEKGVFVTEEKSYYTPEGTVAFTGTRKSKDEDILNDLHFIAMQNKAHDPITALSIINQTGAYSTLFQGFEEAMGKSSAVAELRTATLKSLVLFSAESLL
jgi:hypothetical protein